MARTQWRAVGETSLVLMALLTLSAAAPATEEANLAGAAPAVRVSDEVAVEAALLAGRIRATAHAGERDEQGAAAALEKLAASALTFHEIAIHQDLTDPRARRAAERVVELAAVADRTLDALGAYESIRNDWSALRDLSIAELAAQIRRAGARP